MVGVNQKKERKWANTSGRTRLTDFISLTLMRLQKRTSRRVKKKSFLTRETHGKTMERSQAQQTQLAQEWVAFSFSRVSSHPRDRTQVSSLQVDSLPAKPHRKPKQRRKPTQIIIELLQVIMDVASLDIADDSTLG